VFVNSKIQQANNILVQLQNDESFWQYSDTILDSDSDPNTKFFALKALEEAIKVGFPYFFSKSDSLAHFARK
jgi:hypothetical protein